MAETVFDQNQPNPPPVSPLPATTQAPSVQPLANNPPPPVTTPAPVASTAPASSLHLPPKKKRPSPVIFIVIVLVLLALIAAAIWYFFFKDHPATPASSDWQTSDQLTLVPYREIKTSYTASIPAYTIDPNELENLAAFQAHEFDSAAKQAGKQNTDFTAGNLDWLRELHSFVAPTYLSYSVDPDNENSNRTDDWTKLYVNYAGSTHPCYRQPDDSIFITTDFMAHLYHRLFERQMEYTDKEEFAPRLKTLTTQLLADTKQAQRNSDQANQASFERLGSYLLVADALLNNVAAYGEAPTNTYEPVDTLDDALARLNFAGRDWPNSVTAQARQELERIFAAEGADQSVIFAGLVPSDPSAPVTDYTQFTPRSYYNKNATLRSYFRAMIWYGRTGFDLASPELTRDALNLTALINDNQEVLDFWQAIYNPTSFMVGTSDDLAIFDYAPFLTKKAVDDQLIASVQAQASSFKAPQIFSNIVISDEVLNQTEEELLLNSLGWRLMGQRTVADAVIFDQLTQGDTAPDPITGEKLPSTATAPMVMAALGSQTAQRYLDAWAQANFPKSTQVLTNRTNALREEFAGLPINIWTQNAYWSWLYLYRTLINEQKDWTGYPLFMSFDNWREKDLNTMIGSWTELKHSTLLYAKQSYAEMGAGEDDCEVLPPPKGYVEPNIEFYDRLESLAVMVNENLEQYGVLHEEISYRTDSFLEYLRFYRDLAVKQLANEVISDEEFEQLQRSALALERLPAVLGDEVQTERESRSALIADVQTDVLANIVVYEATGVPQTLYIAVKDANGARLAKGLVYSHYEFNAPRNQQRLTDELWQEQIYQESGSRSSSSLPPLSLWSSSL